MVYHQLAHTELVGDREAITTVLAHRAYLTHRCEQLGREGSPTALPIGVKKVVDWGNVVFGETCYISSAASETKELLGLRCSAAAQMQHHATVIVLSQYANAIDGILRPKVRIAKSLG